MIVPYGYAKLISKGGEASSQLLPGQAGAGEAAVLGFLVAVLARGVARQVRAALAGWASVFVIQVPPVARCVTIQRVDGLALDLLLLRGFLGSFICRN